MRYVILGIILNIYFFSAFSQSVTRDTAKFSGKKNTIKVAAFAIPFSGGISAGHEFMFNNRIAGEYIYTVIVTFNDNGFVRNSYLVGAKYYLKPNGRFKYNIGVYYDRVVKDRWIDQSEISNILDKSNVVGVSLGGKFNLSNTFTLDFGTGLGYGRTKSSGYGIDQIEVYDGTRNIKYSRRVYYYKDKIDWRFFLSPRLHLGIQF